MKKATTILGMVFLATSLMSFQGKPECETECENLQIEDIPFIEVAEEIELGFDTAQYLPKGFDAYKSMHSIMDKITFIEKEEDVDLDFDTAQYLPEGFDAYEGMALDIEDIIYIEEEEEVMLNFDVQNYLPKNFNALSK